MADLIFYTNPQSRGRIVRWMLEEVGQPYDTEIIHYDDLKTDRYLAVNPMGKVPAIKHRGHVVTECAAICAYLADVFPEAKLGPTVERESGLLPLVLLCRRAGRTGVHQPFDQIGEARPSANACSAMAITTGLSRSWMICSDRGTMCAEIASRRRTSMSVADHVSDAIRHDSRARNVHSLPRSPAGARRVQARGRDR